MMLGKYETSWTVTFKSEMALVTNEFDIPILKTKIHVKPESFFL